jgi:SAM-dependent methyltransferase
MAGRPAIRIIAMSRRSTIAAIALTLLASGSVALGARCLSPEVARCSWATLTGNAPKLDVPYLGTRPAAVARMLDMAAVGPGDRVIDLGTGDGRILIAAARRGASGLGVDIDPVLVAEAQGAAGRAGVGDRTRFAAQDLFATPLAEYSVVTMFLLPRVNLALRPRLLRELTPGTRIVSHAFDMGDWRPDAVERAGGSRLLMWRVPASVAGEWQLGDGTRLSLTQQFQVVSGMAVLGNGITVPVEGRLAGRALRLTAAGRRYEGSVAGDTISGAGWAARRVSPSRPGIATTG